MNKAQQMLAKAGFPDTAAGRAAFHKRYPTPESFFQVHGNQDTEMYDAGSTIHIDPSKRGTFTAAATKHGKSVQGFASQVLANKEDYSPAMVKKANFARNAANWKHQDGGPVMYGAGGPFEEQPGEDPFAAGKSYLEGWQSSPMFKNIIQNQAEAMYPSKPKAAADYYKRNTTPMYIPQGKSLMGVSAKNNDPNLYVRYFPKDIIGVEKGLMDRDPALGNNLYTRAAILDYNPPTAMDDEIINNTPARVIKGELNEYEYGDPLKASIHGLRQAGQAAGIYDPFTTPFKKEYINQYNEFYKTNPTNNPLNQLLKFYTPDQVEYFMNNISQNQSTPGMNMQMAAVGGMVSDPPPYTEQEAINNARLSGTYYNRFGNSGFGFNGPGSYSYYKDRLDNRNVKTVNPHAGVKDTPVNMHTITGSCEAGNCYEFHKDGGTVDALQLMGMPTPRMYGPGSRVESNFHPSLTLSTESNPNKSKEFNNPFYGSTMPSINNRTTLTGTVPLYSFNPYQRLNFVGSYNQNSGATNPAENYSAGLGLNFGEALTGAAGRYTPSRRFDNSNIAHKGHSFLDIFGNVGAGFTTQKGTYENDNATTVVPYYSGDLTVAHQMGRIPRINQPRGTAYLKGEFKAVENPNEAFVKNNTYVNKKYVDDNYVRANLGGSYNFGKGLGIYGEAGYDFLRGAPRGEVGLKKTFADGGHVTDYSPSSNFGTVQSMNNTYMHGYGNGGGVYTQANAYNNSLINPSYVNSQIPMYAKGGLLNKIESMDFGKLGNTLYNTGLLYGDSIASIFGGKDIIGDKRYKGNTYFGDSSDTFTDASHWTGETLESAIPTVISFVPGIGTAVSAGLSGLQAGVGALTPADQDRLQSKSGQDAAKLGMGLKLAGAVTTLGTSAANAGKAGADLAKAATTAPKTIKTVADISKAAKYAGVAADAYNTAKDPDANWKDWTRVGLNAAGTLGSNMSSTGMEGVRNVNNPFGSMQGIKDLQKFSSIAGAGDTLSNVAQAGKAGMSLYNTGENIDRYGLNSQTTMQGINALNQGLGAASNFSDNQNFQDFANTSNALGSAANFGMSLYNTANSGSKDTMDYLSSLPQGLYSAAQLNNLYGKRAMGGAVNAPNMMQYASGGNIGYNELDLTELSKQNNLMDNSRLLGYNLIGTDKFDAGSYVDNKKPTSMKEDYQMFLKAKPVTKYYSPAMPPHPSDGSMDPRGTVVGTIDPQTGKPVEINVEGKEGRWLLPNGEHFITTKKDTKEILAMHKNGDLDGMATKMYNIKTAKEKKDAEAAAQQQAREAAARQLEAMQMQAAKYGGMVNQYGYGGGVRMYGGGSGIYDPNSIVAPLQGQALPASISPSGYPTYVDPSGGSDYTYSYIPGKGWMTYKAGSNKGISLSGNSNFQPTIDLLNKTYLNRVGLLNNPVINSDVSDPIYTSSFFDPDASIEMPPEQPLSQDEQNAIWDAKMKEVDLITPEKNYLISHSYIDDTYKKKNKDKDSSFSDAALTAAQLLPIGYNLYNAIFGKPLNYHPAQIPKLTWMNRSGEPERRALKEAYATAKYGTPRGSGYLAERTQRAADYMNAMANLETNIANINNQGYMDTQAKNAGFTAQDIANEMAANQLNLQALANQQNLGTTAVTQLGQLADAKSKEKMYKNFYKTFSGGHYMLDKNGIPVYIGGSEKTSDKKDKKDKKKD